MSHYAHGYHYYSARVHLAIHATFIIDYFQIITPGYTITQHLPAALPLPTSMPYHCLFTC